MIRLRADGFPEQEVRARAALGLSAVFPVDGEYGAAMFGEPACHPPRADPLDRMRLVPPVFMPERLAQLVELGREPTYQDVSLITDVGGFRAALPVYVSAFGSTAVAAELGSAVARQAARLGVPMVIGENVVAASGYRTADGAASILGRIKTYLDNAEPGVGGVVVQQSTEDADAELWNRIYSDPDAAALAADGRLGFELKVGQGAKPGLGGMTLVTRDAAQRVAAGYLVDEKVGGKAGVMLRSATPGTFTTEILRSQIRLLRNNFPRTRLWIKLPPARDVGDAAELAWAQGADAVTVDGAEGGTGWAPSAFLHHVGLPLAECLTRLDVPEAACLLVSGRMWEGARAVKCLALGARAVGLGRAALLAVHESEDDGLVQLVGCLALEMRMLISALGKYCPAVLSREDVWIER